MAVRFEEPTQGAENSDSSYGGRPRAATAPDNIEFAPASSVTTPMHAARTEPNERADMGRRRGATAIPFSSVLSGSAMNKAKSVKADIDRWCRRNVRTRTFGVLMADADSEELKYTALKTRKPDEFGMAPTSSREMDSDLSLRSSPSALVDEDEGLTISSAVFLLVTAIIGCGVVALPSLMKLGGWIIVPVLMALITLAFMEIARVIDASISAVETSAATDGGHCITSFEDFGRIAFGDAGALVVRSVTTTGFFGNLVVYTILIGKNGASLTQILIGRPLPQFFVTAALLPVLLSLAMLKDLRAMASIMPVGVFASLTSCALICIKSGLDAQAWQGWPEMDRETLHSLWPDELQSLGMIIAILFSAFSVMGTVPSIRGQMQDPQQFLKAFRLAVILVFLVYMCVMILGYWGYGNLVHENVVDSMLQPLVLHQRHQRGKNAAGHKSDHHGNHVEHAAEHHAGVRTQSFLGCFMASLVVTYLLIGFALFFACVMGIVQKLGGGSSLDLCTAGTWQNCALRCVLVLAVSGLGMAVPHFREVMAIMSSVCCSCNNVFFPLAFSHKLAKDRNAEELGICRKICHTGILCLAIFCAGLGLTNSVSSLCRKMSSP